MPAPYAFKQIFAVDPSNSANVANDASVIIYAPGDPNLTPLAITDLSGVPLPNPVKTNGKGFSSSFMAPLDQVAWSGGGLNGTFESYEGIKTEAVAARNAAQQSANGATAAANSANEAAENAATGAAGALAGAVADAKAAKVAAQASAGLVGAPAGSAVLAAIKAGGAAYGELSATFGPLNKGVIQIGTSGSNGLHNEALLAAQQAALAATRPSADTHYGTWRGTRVIDLPAGDYRITELRGLLGKEGISSSRRGIRFRGAGSNLTHIVFDPSADGALVYNDYWQNIAFEGISFTTERAGATFMQSYTTHAAQKYTFTDVAWTGPWGRVFDLQGTDNNSEYSFYACEASDLIPAGCFLYVGNSNTSEQFLNYWFYGFKLWSTSAPLIDAAKGGHYHIYGFDASDWGVALTAPGYLFYLRNSVLASGAKSLTVDGLRSELKNANAGLLYSEWGHGNVNIQADISSQRNKFEYNDIIDLRFDLGDELGGAVYNFHNSELVGGVKITYGENAGFRQHRITFDNVDWRQRERPTDAVTYVAKGATRRAKPPVRFINCRALSQNAGDLTGGAAVWDAIVGWNDGDRMQQIEKRSLHLKGHNGNISTGDGAKALLPVGAMITGMRVLTPAGTVPTTTELGTWFLKTAEATNNVVMMMQGTNPRSDGYNAVQTLPAPFLCNTKERASLTVTAGSTTTSDTRTIVIIEGYW